ncbi:MAG TPA: N-6 DNA methylase [Phaeodactylibacter sp.]|nr:N-6 DNA methylase [Phaeodactylibacter sp.]
MSAGRTVNSKSQSWGTPLKYVKAIKRFFGGSIALDPCSNEYSIVHAEAEFMLPHNDGLKEDWNYPTIYVNPPYGADRERGTTIKNWLVKCALTHQKYGSEILALVPVATNTGHWKQSIFGQARAICFLYDTRLKFLENGLDVGKGAPMACAMIYWGQNYEKFYDIFIEYGAVVDISNLQGEEIGSTRKHMKLKFE